MFIQNTPNIRVKVDNKFLTPKTPEGFTEGYIIAVTSIAGRPLFFNVHLITGALFNRLPINALYCERFSPVKCKTPIVLADAQPFSCLEGEINCIEYSHLKNCEVRAKVGLHEKSGSYLFTVDVVGSGLAEDPEQYKAHNIICLSSGNLVALPNNHLLFTDGFFAEGLSWPKYERQTSYHLAGA